MIGFGANRRGGRLPSLLLVALAVVLAVLSFNYWTAARQQGRLRDEAAEARAQVKRTDAARSRLETQAEQKDAGQGEAFVEKVPVSAEPSEAGSGEGAVPVTEEVPARRRQARPRS